MGRPPADPQEYQLDPTDQEYQPDPTDQEDYSADMQEPSYYQATEPQDQQQQQQPPPQQYPTPPPQQGFGPQRPVQQPAQFPPQSPIRNPNQPTATAYPPQSPRAYPPPPPTHQPVQFPPPQSQNPNQPAAGPYSYPPQGNPANQPVQFPPRSPPPTNPMYPNQNPAPYPPPQDFPVKPTQPQPVQFPPHNPVTGYNMPPTVQKPPPQPNNNIPGQVFNQNWSTGIFDCMNEPENAMETAFLPCVTFGQNAEIIDNGQTTCLMNGMVYTLFIWMPFVVSCGFRTKLRAKYGLIEDPAPDWITHLLFHWCALCQEYRELKHRGFDPAIGWQANMESQNMQQQPQVAMAPPMNQRMMP